MNTVRGNDVAFAIHALVLSAVTLSMFWERLWGLEQGGKRAGTVGRAVWVIVGGSAVGVAWCVVQVLVEGGADGGGVGKAGKGEKVGVEGRWEWIDVVSPHEKGYAVLPSSPRGIGESEGEELTMTRSMRSGM